MREFRIDVRWSYLVWIEKCGNLGYNILYFPRNHPNYESQEYTILQDTGHSCFSWMFYPSTKHCFDKVCQ